MQGSVYQISSCRYGNQPHLYVVVLAFSGNQDCIVVPAFSAEGHMVNEVIESRLVEGFQMHQIAVTLDNAKYIRFVSQHTGKLAHWLISDADRLLLSNVSAETLVGKMSPEGLQQIAAGLLSFAPSTSRFSNNVLKKLRQLVDG